MCCHVYELLGPSVLPISRFSLQLRIRNLFLWCMFFFYTEPRFGRVTCLQVLRLPEKHQLLKTGDETVRAWSAASTMRPFYTLPFLDCLDIKCG